MHDFNVWGEVAVQIPLEDGETNELYFVWTQNGGESQFTLDPTRQCGGPWVVSYYTLNPTPITRNKIHMQLNYVIKRAHQKEGHFDESIKMALHNAINKAAVNQENE